MNLHKAAQKCPLLTNGSNKIPHAVLDVAFSLCSNFHSQFLWNTKLCEMFENSMLSCGF